MKALGNKLNLLLKGFARRRIMVLGDFVADRYIYGRSSAVSREAPVLILDYSSDDLHLGGGANALNNLLSLGCAAVPVGAVGKDPDGQNLIAKIRAAGADADALFAVQARPTTTKTRIMAGALHTTYQQVIRIDRGEHSDLPRGIQKKIMDFVLANLASVNGIIVSDYNYGVIRGSVRKRINRIAKESDVPVFIDSRYDLLSFKDVYAVTPNESEVENALGVQLRSDADVEKAAKILMEKISPQCVLITRGRKGMYLLTAEGESYFIPIFGSDEITDVTGAGDTVIAVFTLAIASGANAYEAAVLANVAGGLVVMKAGTATVSSGELSSALKLL